MTSKSILPVSQKASLAEGTWGGSYTTFPALINKFNLRIGAEIGVAYAGHIESMLTKTKIKKIYGVDPYRHIIDYDDPMNISDSEFDEIFLFVKQRMHPFKDRYIHLRERSSMAVKNISSPLDFVYLDADHSYDGVWDELCDWFPKIRDGGIIGGHDYNHPNFPGIKEAVDRFFGRFGWEVNYEKNTVWWVKKTNIPISFIIPAFNCAKTIADSIKSIYNNNYTNGDEVIVVNDASTDNTRKILSRLQTKHKSLKVVSHKFNRGGGAARNTAVRHSRNVLIFCLDSDNILAPDSITKLKKHLIEKGADAACFQELRYFNTSFHNITHVWKFRTGEVYLRDFLLTYRVPGSSGNYLYTKESHRKAGGYPEYAKALDAWGFGFRQLATGSKMIVLGKTYYFHRYGTNSYWMRSFKSGNPSKYATQIVLEHGSLIDKKDLKYLTNSDNWFQKLESKHIHLTDKPSTLKDKLYKFLVRH